MISEKKLLTESWFAELRDIICSAYTEIEANNHTTPGTPSLFTQKKWSRGEGQGGGVMSFMKGSIFEKVGVNISTVYGEIPKNLPISSNKLKAGDEFWASGISTIAHMKNPFVPAFHMNTRYFVTKNHSWFGGVTDLNPIYNNDEDTNYFHNILEKICNKFDPNYYTKFKSICDEYFFIKHRNRTRGVGGIFYDHLNTGNFEHDFAFSKEVGISPLLSFVPLVKKYFATPYSQEHKEEQAKIRGYYAEFNLMYDKGTKFGFSTNGNAEAILMSLPPMAKWDF